MATGSLTFTSTTPIVQLTGLIPGQQYQAYATCKSADGTSQPSGTVTFVEPQQSTNLTVPGVPGAPVAAAGTAGSGQASLTWTAPTSGGAVASYTVTVLQAGGQVKTVSNITGTSATVTGLTVGTGFTFTVLGVNAAGPGSSSNVSNSIDIAGAPVVSTTNLLPASVAAMAIPLSTYTLGGGTNAPTLAFSTAVAPMVAGSQVVKATINAGGTKAYWQPTPVAANLAGCSGNTQYSCSTAYQPTASGVQGSAQIQWYSSSLTLLSYSKGTVIPLPANVWTAATVTANSPASAALMTPQPTVDVAANNGVIYVANAKIAAGASALPWTPGQGVINTVPAVMSASANGLAVSTQTGQITGVWTSLPANGGLPITGVVMTATPVTS